MEENEGLPYYLDIKFRCWKTLPIILDMQPEDLAPRGAELTPETAKDKSILTDFEKEKAGPTLKASKHVCAI